MTDGDTKRIPPQGKHQLALIISVCVFPTRTALNLVSGDRSGTMSSVLRTLVLATVAVPIVIYGFTPSLHRLRVRLPTPSRPRLKPVSKGIRAPQSQRRSGSTSASRRAGLRRVSCRGFRLAPPDPGGSG